MAPRFIKASEYFKNIAQTVYLYKNIWRENSTALLHAPREIDKTATAIDIALDLAAKGRKVVYVDCDQQLDRHLDALTGAPDSLSIYIPTFASPDDKTDYADLVINAIEEIARTTSIRTFVIGSVTRIAALSFGRNASVSYVMKRLVAMQVRYQLSLLVISHDSTKATERSLLNLANSEILLLPDPTPEQTPKATDTLKHHLQDQNYPSEQSLRNNNFSRRPTERQPTANRS